MDFIYIKYRGDFLTRLSFAKFPRLVFAALSLVGWLSLSHATDSRCPPGMHSPDGSVCIPGGGTYDEDVLLDSIPSGFQQPMEHRDIHWSAFAMDKKKLLVTDKEMKFIGVSRKHKSMKEAQKAALAMCKSDGSSNCEIIETVINQCLAISISPEANKLAYSFNANMQLSIDDSLRKCNHQYQSCKTVFADCFND